MLEYFDYDHDVWVSVLNKQYQSDQSRTRGKIFCQSVSLFVNFVPFLRPTKICFSVGNRVEDVARAVTGGLQVLAEVRGADRRSMFQVVSRPTSPNSPNNTDLGVIITRHQFGSFGDTLLDGSDGEVLDLRMRTEKV